MAVSSLRTETTVAIILGLLQILVGLISLWQQRQLQRAYRERCMMFWVDTAINNVKSRDATDEDTLFDAPFNVSMK
jgi:hypothetical protein